MTLHILEIDTSTPHPGVTIDRSRAHRETNGGWVTLRAKEPLTASNCQWGVKIINHGESSDTTGLMIGLLPALSHSLVASMGNKYISELGGWGLSRAGESYGSWKCDKLPFTTGSVVEFDWDGPSKTLYIVCGKRRVMGRILELGHNEVLFPAISLYYLNQTVSFV